MTFEQTNSIRVNPGNPCPNGCYDHDDQTLGEMIQTVFSLDSGDASLEFAGSIYGLNYKYDISFLIDDLLSLISIIQGHPDGTKTIAWPSSGFAFRWEIEWRNEQMRICSIPHNMQSTTSGSGEELFAYCRVDHFIREWIPVFRNIVFAGNLSGYKIPEMTYGQFMITLANS